MSNYIPLGIKVRDIVTGFSGVAVARCQYLYSATTIGVLSPNLTHEGRPLETIWVEENRLESTEKEEEVYDGRS